MGEQVAIAHERLHECVMRVHTGTSGFSFDEWHGQFYPLELPADQRLEHYASRLRSVEINNTFYQMPKVPLLERWRDTVPEGFRFAIKAPRRITHVQRLKNSSESVAYFVSAVATLGAKLGPVLFQLPPFVRKDVSLLSDFMAELPVSLEAAFEFRHPSWFDDDVLTLLASRNAALCLGDVDESGRAAPFVSTATFGYLRLRAEEYDEMALRDWSKRILAERWTSAYVFLKHEVHGPQYAMYLAAIASGNSEPVLKVEEAVAVAKKVASSPKKGLARTKPTTPERGVSNSRSRATVRRKSA